MDDFDFWKSNYFLNKAKQQARKTGYDPNNLYIADNKKNKLYYLHDDKKIYFGRLGYGDFIYYSSDEFKKTGKFDNDSDYKKFALQKRNTFRKSHNEITKKFDLGKYTPNELALKILW